MRIRERVSALTRARRDDNPPPEALTEGGVAGEPGRRLSVAFLVFNLDGMGGTSRSAITQANALVERGHDVRLISVTRNGDSPHYLVDPRVGVDYLVDVRGTDGQARRRSLLVPKRWDGQFFRACDEPLRETLQALEVDVLVTVTPALLAVAAQLLPRSVALVHQEHRSSADRVGGMEPLLAFAPRADVVALLTEASADWLAGELGDLGPELVVMPNPLPQAQQPRSDLTSRLIVAAGRLVPEKQMIHAIRAFGEVAGDLPEWRLRILGDGPLLGELRAVVAKLGLSDRIELPGAVSDMSSEWAQASICVLTSRTEGFPLVSQEAMSAGVPVVSYDCPSGPREQIIHGHNGLLVAPGSKPGLAAALVSLMQNDAQREELGQGAFATAQRWAAPAIAARWEGVFAAAVRRRRSGDTPQPGQRVHTRGRTPEAEDLALTPAQARNTALEYAVRAAAATGDDWFVVPPREALIATVVVPADQREALLDGLESQADLTARSSGWSLLDPGTHGWPERRLTVTDMVALQRRARTGRLVLEPWPRGRDGRRTSLAADCGVAIEFWDRRPDGRLVAPLPQAVVTEAGRPDSTARVCEVEVPTLSILTKPLVTEVSPPIEIDVVVTWVDGDDPDWNAARERRLAGLAGHAGDVERRESSGQARFRSRDELRYALRSLHLFAPWVRQIYLVTAGQRPGWLADHPGVRMVDHSEILPAEALPTFNSQAIETGLHRIPGLSEQFIYLNDDVMLGRPLRPELFFSPGGNNSVFFSDHLVGEPGPDAKPFLQAAANNRRLLLAEYDALLTRVLAHSPHPHRVSTLQRIEAMFPGEISATARSPFRSPTDLSLLSSLGQQFGLCDGTARSATATHAFIDLAGARVERQLAQLRQRNLDFFCIGDHHVFAQDTEAVDAALMETLEWYFPIAAPWER